ncbi:DUF4906 domain-containing protein [uncultured Parabacteroides sp.]|uniref:DUF4906 domain-containing protein n=1 Tax=uncultured Parabacteroides sp. TaxID=512312 RepID=UPI0025955273|nr:DUF4906 domain-containing protein [uncultured Parabacteroides sp.]
MTLLSLVLISTGCEEQIDTPAVNPSEGKTVEVTLNIGLADETDGYTLSAPSGTKSSVTAFYYTLQPRVSTKGVVSSLKPDKLYNLEIQQYDRSGNRIGGMSGVVAEQEIGSSLNLDLKASSDCQLVIVAWGSGNSTTLGTGDLASAQAKSVDASVISKLIPSTQTDMNKMPYVLHLEHVCVDSNTIKSIDGEDKDIRLLLRRLATRLTLDWTYSYSGYQLKQILLQSIPLNYKVVATPDKDDKTYPSLLDQFTTIQLTTTQINARTYSCWIPANVRGSNPAATSQRYRIKSNAPTGSSYVDFIAANTSESKKKLSYRVYLGGSESSDFNLYDNMDYNYKVTIDHKDLPVNDRRVTIINPIAASESNSNLVPTSNCFMVAPGGAFCFDPFAYSRNGTNANTNSTLKGWSDSEGGIASVKLVWQTKEYGDIGEPVMGVVNTNDDHSNIVHILKNDGSAVSAANPLTDIGQGRVYCRVAPNTEGGNGLIAAYNKNGDILWSWHIWVTDYAPDHLSDETVLEPANKRKQKYIGNGAADQLPMMDRNIGALAGYVELPKKPLEMSRANGVQYQRGRKDPFLSSYTQKAISSVDFDPNSDTPPEGLQNMYGPDGLTYIKRQADGTAVDYRMAYKNPYNKYSSRPHWNSNKSNSTTWNSSTKDFNDPCPDGWRVPVQKNFQALFNGTWLGRQTSLLLLRNMNTKEANNNFIEAGLNNGLMLTYDDAGNKSYFRYTGYASNSTMFLYIGSRLNCMVCEYGSTLVVNSINSDNILFCNVNTDGTWNECDAHSIRCIQERK